MTPTPDSADTPQQIRDSFVQGHCQPCEGGVEPIAAAEARRFTAALAAWQLDDSGTAISRSINAGTFAKAIELLQQVATLAEQQQHHPDLHLTGYRHLKIVLTTHAIGGLSENDFIMAAKIDEVLP